LGFDFFRLGDFDNKVMNVKRKMKMRNMKGKWVLMGLMMKLVINVMNEKIKNFKKIFIMFNYPFKKIELKMPPN